MRALTSALREAGAAGEPLPEVFPQLRQMQADIRLGELTMIASAPGVGKSVLASILAIGIKKPSMVFSADTSAHTTAVRCAAHLTGRPVSEVDGIMSTDRTYYDRVLREGAGHVQWDFSPMPSIKDLFAEVESFAVAYGDYPHLIVVDNLRNIYSEEEDYAALRHSAEALRTLAVETGSAVVVLHHLTGEYESGDNPPSLAALEGKVGKFPALVLTLSNGKSGDMRVSVVKNRYGPASPAGRLCFFLPVDMQRMRIG